MFSDGFKRVIRGIAMIILTLVLTGVFYLPTSIVLNVAGLSSAFVEEAFIINLCASLALAALVSWSVDRSTMQHSKTNPSKPPNRTGTLILAVLLVGAGLFTGFAMGVIAAFGCWKSECSSFQETAWLTLPVASLLFTIPLAVHMNRRAAPSGQPNTDEQPPTDEPTGEIIEETVIESADESESVDESTEIK